MDRSEIEFLLECCSSPDAQKRSTSESKILSLRDNNFSTFVSLLIQIFTEEDMGKTNIRTTAGIVLRNSLHAVDPTLQSAIECKWINTNSDIKEIIKKSLAKNMASKLQRIRSLSAGTLAGIARIEIPLQHWPTFFKDITAVMASIKNDLITEAMLECVGILCGYLTSEISFDFSMDAIVIYNLILSKIGNSKNKQIKYMALKALVSSLEAFSTIINEDNIQTTIMKILNMISEDNDPEIIKYSLDILIKLLDLYYEKLQIMGEIIIFVKKYYTSKNEEVLLKVVYFWTVICELELEYKMNSIVEQNLDNILPFLLKGLFKTDEYDEDSWNLHKVATACLTLISIVSTREILSNNIIKDFISKNLEADNDVFELEYGNEDYSNCYNKEIGIIALGSVLVRQITQERLFLKECTDKTANLLSNQSLNMSALWALSKVSENNFDSVDPGSTLPVIMDEAIKRLGESNKLAVNAAYLIANMCTFVGKGKNLTWTYDNNLSFFYMNIINGLVVGTEKVPYNNFNLRTALFHALTEAMDACSDSSSAILDKFLTYLTKKLEECLAIAERANTDQFLILEDIMTNYIILLQKVISVKGENNMKEQRKPILHLFTRILSINRISSVFGDIYSALSNMCTPSSYFTANLDKIMPFILRDLKNATESSTDRWTLKEAINFIGDTANLLNQGFLRYSSQMVPLLIQCLNSQKIENITKINILSVFSDIALALGSSFDQYFDVCLSTINSIISLNRYTNIIFIDQLRKNSIILLNSIIISMGECKKIYSEITNIVYMLKIVCEEDERNYSALQCLDLITDITNIHGPGCIITTSLVEYIKNQCNNKDKKIREKAKDVKYLLENYRKE
ncbi:Karyopherin [Spraguea lophii 42_110]|uniref:Karyopherin n=1 Tax=Spraguea lophii (strain 42_110) TaxID=1358809 RepID=S7XR91_SPRLO|nr:Karyopherin [Spraguea lophii 42_110]